MITYLWIAIGGALGSVSRYWLSGLVANRFGETFPWGTIGEWLYAGGNILFSVALCLAGVWLGHALAFYLNLMKRN